MQNEDYRVDFSQTDAEVISLLDRARNDSGKRLYPLARRKISQARTLVRNHINLFSKFGDKMTPTHRKRLDNLSGRIDKFQERLTRLEQGQ